MKRNKRRNNNPLPPLTPMPPEPERIKVVPDTHAEQILFELYMREKALKQAALSEVRRLRMQARYYIALRKISRTVRLKPTHNPAPREKK